MAFKGLNTVIGALDSRSDKNDISIKDIALVPLNNSVKADFGKADTAHTISKHFGFISYKSMDTSDLISHYRNKRYA